MFFEKKWKPSLNYAYHRFYHKHFVFLFKVVVILLGIIYEEWCGNPSFWIHSHPSHKAIFSGERHYKFLSFVTKICHMCLTAFCLKITNVDSPVLDRKGNRFDIPSYAIAFFHEWVCYEIMCYDMKFHCYGMSLKYFIFPSHDVCVQAYNYQHMCNS